MFSNNNPKLTEIRDQAAKLQVIKNKQTKTFFLRIFFLERKRQDQERKQKSEHEKILNAIKV
jgi:hypothetical protein